MNTLLHIDASPRATRSHSRKLGQEFVAAWRANRPNGQVVNRDIGREPPPFVSEAWVEGAFTPPDQHSPAARQAIEISNQYVDELLAADHVLISTPIYNLSIPASLKAWIDQIVRAGRTFGFGAAGLEGLVKGKRMTVVVASGSDFRPSSSLGALNHIEPYLRAVFGFIGITDVEFIYAHSLNDNGSLREQSLGEAQQSVRKLAAA
jgi:FMN-dependent NADH-azoreductase